MDYFKWFPFYEKQQAIDYFMELIKKGLFAEIRTITKTKELPDENGYEVHETLGYEVDVN